jgi:hypothetical protein
VCNGSLRDWDRNKLDVSKLSPAERRVIIVAAPAKEGSIRKDIKRAGTFGTVGAVGVVVSGVVAGPVFGIPLFAGALLSRPLLRSREKDRLDTSVVHLTVNEAATWFAFPPGHPVIGTAYACSDLEPRLYVPLASFHEFMWQHKMSAFTTLCSRLGAKRVIVLYAEEDGKDVTVSIEAVGGIASAEGDSNNTRKVGAQIYGEFGEPDSAPVKTETGWIVTEPTWLAMQEERLEGNLLRRKAEIHYVDDMGIRANLATVIGAAKAEIGGKFKEFHRKKWVFDVEFWPKTKL